jgi:hypothetical protein
VATASHHDSRRTVLAYMLVVASIAVVTTTAHGAHLDYRQQWGYL